MDITIVSTQVMAITGMITGIAAVIVLIANLIRKAKSPSEIQNHRIAELEHRVDLHDEYFAKDLKRFESLESGMRVLQHAILALLAHGIDDNNIESLKSAKKDLEEYLISR